MKRTVIAIFIGMLACGAFASEPEKSTVVFDFEGADAASFRGIELSSEQAKTGSASALWANHTEQGGISSSDIPHDWSEYDTLTMWMYSAVANDAEFMLLVYSENEDSDGADYYSREIKVDWTGWRYFDIPFNSLGKSREPIGWDKIDSLRFAATGWSNEPKADTVIYLDDVRLVKYGARLRNASFDDDLDGNGEPDSWSFSPQGEDETARATLVDGGRTGKAVRIVDQNEKQGVGVSQRVQVVPGKTYTVSAWKKGDDVAYYLNFYDAANKRIEPEHNKGFDNQNTDQWERFEYSVQAPEGAQSVSVWFYSYSSNTGTVFLDDAELTESD